MLFVNKKKISAHFPHLYHDTSTLLHVWADICYSKFSNTKLGSNFSAVSWFDTIWRSALSIEKRLQLRQRYEIIFQNMTSTFTVINNDYVHCGVNVCIFTIYTLYKQRNHKILNFNFEGATLVASLKREYLYSYGL